MSINGVFRTSVSGMNAQANKLSAVSDNIANSSTNGYKRADVEFSSLVIDSGSSTGDYQSGSILSQKRRDISMQGLLTTTSSSTDLAISGDGFFAVEDRNGLPAYTRAGSFVQRTEPGTDQTFLVNAAGYRLVGENGPIEVPVGEIVPPQPTANAAIAMQLPLNGADEYTGSFVAYNSRGEAVDVSMTATRSATDVDTWDYTFTAPSEVAPLTGQIVFDPTTGEPTSITPAALEFQINPPAGEQDGTPSTIVMDFTNVTSYDAAYSFQAETDGNPPTGYSEFMMDNDGTFYGILTTGKQVALEQVQLARFRSPDQLQAKTGNIFAPTQTSGDPQFGFAGDLGFGSLVAGALEESNVDLASELTDMIVSQRSYSANSKVFQTGSEMLDLLVNLKR